MVAASSKDMLNYNEVVLLLIRFAASLFDIRGWQKSFWESKRHRREKKTHERLSGSHVDGKYIRFMLFVCVTLYVFRMRRVRTLCPVFQRALHTGLRTLFLLQWICQASRIQIGQVSIMRTCKNLCVYVTFAHTLPYSLSPPGESYLPTYLHTYLILILLIQKRHQEYIPEPDMFNVKK